MVCLSSTHAHAVTMAVAVSTSGSGIKHPRRRTPLEPQRQQRVSEVHQWGLETDLVSERGRISILLQPQCSFYKGPRLHRLLFNIASTRTPLICFSSVIYPSLWSSVRPSQRDKPLELSEALSKRQSMERPGQRPGEEPSTLCEKRGRW